MKTEEEIKEELDKLEPFASQFDEDDEKYDNIIAAGAYSALLWILDDDLNSVSNFITNE